MSADNTLTQDETDQNEVLASLITMNLVGKHETPTFEPLTGGVSSAIWKVGTKNGPICVKRALSRLKVEAVWEVAPERSRLEADWMRTARAVRPFNIPELLGEDIERHVLAMDYLAPEDNALWKSVLRDEQADPQFAADLARTIAAIHAATAHDADVAARFASDLNFHAIRLEPYLEATARKHQDVHQLLMALSQRTAAQKHCLVHGDLSPKNILMGKHGPILLDAECAWYGDPAFDVAFLLNHLLLKCIWRPRTAQGFLACFAAFRDAYLDRIDWERPADLEARASSLLPGLLLARVDGKSPVEYVTDSVAKQRIRSFAKPLLLQPPKTLEEVRLAWAGEFAG